MAPTTRHHALLYFGWFSKSFHLLHPDQTKYWTKGEPEKSQPVELPSFAPTVSFAVMQTPGGYVLVKVDELCLPTPTLFVGGRHGPQAPGPAHVKLNDDHAAAILVDMLVDNPGLRDDLGMKLRSLAVPKGG